MTGVSGGAMRAWERLVDLATTRLRSDGWSVAAVHREPLAPWHVAATKASRWRVVQILPPATPATDRHDRRLSLAHSVRLAAKQGTMEQWLAHTRPGGRVIFGAEILYGQMWAGVAPESELPQRLGLSQV